MEKYVELTYEHLMLQKHLMEIGYKSELHRVGTDLHQCSVEKSAEVIEYLSKMQHAFGVAMNDLAQQIAYKKKQEQRVKAGEA